MSNNVYVLSFYAEERIGGFDWIPTEQVNIGQMLERIHEDSVQAVGDGIWEWHLHEITIPDYISEDGITDYIEIERMDDIESPDGAIAIVRLNS